MVTRSEFLGRVLGGVLAWIGVDDWNPRPRTPAEHVAETFRFGNEGVANLVNLNDVQIPWSGRSITFTVKP